MLNTNILIVLILACVKKTTKYSHYNVKIAATMFSAFLDKIFIV